MITAIEKREEFREKGEVMSLQEKLASAISLISSYNSNVEPEDQVDVALFEKKLKKLGGTTEELLAEMKWEDLEKCSIPTLLARKIAEIFRKQTVQLTSDERKYLSEKAASRMSPLQLLKAYDPEDATTSVAKRLKEISGGKKFIVFNSNGSVNVAASNSLLKEVQKGYPPRDTYDVDGKPSPIFAIGEGVVTYVDENPLYPGRALRPDGYCDQINRSWNGVSLPVRQLLYLAVRETAEAVVSFDKAHELRDLAESLDAEKKIRSRYRKASVLLDSKEKQGDAPKLKIELNNSQKSSKNDPFFSHRSY